MNLGSITSMEMRLSEETIKTILGIKESVYLSSRSMATNLMVTFFPSSKTTKRAVISFTEKLKTVLENLGVNIISYEQSLGSDNKIKKDIAVIATEGSDYDNLPVKHVANPRANPIVTIVEVSSCLDETASFEEHMNSATRLFAQHMANIIICIEENRWIVYSLNGYSPVYKIDKDFKEWVLRGLIPKIAAPVKPPLLSEFRKLGYRYKNFILRTLYNGYCESKPII